MSNPIKSSIIVLTYNNFKKYTRKCIDSLLATVDLSNNEIIFIDNNSKDETKAELLKLSNSHDNIVFISNTENIGYAAGNNAGIRIARGENIVLLNNDVLVPPGWLESLIKHTDDPKIGLVAPITNNIWSLQKVVMPNLTESNWVTEAAAYCQRHSGVSADVLRVCFFCVLIPRSVIEKIGMLDEGYILGEFEDDDYCCRVSKYYRIVMAEDCFVWHYGSGSFSLVPDSQRTANQIHNKQRYLRKYSEWYLPLNVLLDIKKICITYSSLGFSDSLSFRSDIINEMINQSISASRGYAELISDDTSNMTLKEKIKILDKLFLASSLKKSYSFLKRIKARIT
jgi:GT2 family glycosyltransferase